jgi:serine/threonine-protein kinase
VDELLPVLVARVTRRDDALPAIEAALRQGLAFLRLDEPPSYEGPHALELHVPEWTEPVLLVAEPAGEAVGGEYPLALRPFAPEHVEALVALLAEAGIDFVPTAAPPPPTLEEAPLVDLDLRLSEVPPAAGSPSQWPEVEARTSLFPDRPSWEPAQLVGRVLGGKYSIERKLGSGGMGDVYQATHLALQKPIAVKVLHPSHRHNEEFLQAFHREALAASRLDHPNVVQVLDFGHEKDGLIYIVMELLSGTDLRAVLDKQPVQPIERIVDILGQVAAALSASHDQNVVHRDVKPENIILVQKRDDDGTVRDVVKVCDFGIAEIVERRATVRGKSVQGEVAGTPDYMSPEQVRGGTADARADIYACGVIAFEMATGKVPFYAEQTPEEIAWAHVQKDPPAPSALNPAIPKRLEALIQKAMSKDPARRHQNARELRADLRALLQATPAAQAMQRDPRLGSFTGDDDDVVPPGVVPQFERNDAIDIGDLFTMDPVAAPQPGAVKEQIWVLSEQMATALIQDPASVLQRIDALTDHASYAREMSTLERAMASAANRGAAAALLISVNYLLHRAAGSPPGERTREAIAARAVASIAKPELLLRIAEVALDGPPAARDPARRVLVMLGAPGAHALCAARDRATAQGSGWSGRPRFVAALREVGPAAVPTLTTFLQQAHPQDVAFIEDLLRAVPEPAATPVSQRHGGLDPATERLGTLLSTVHIRHEAPAVRRAAAVALASVWGARANAWLAPLMEDADDGLRIAALAALRKHGGVDRELVRRIERILSGGVPAGSDLRVAAAAALADTTGMARGEAVQVLTAALKPVTGSFFSKLVTADAGEDPLVVTTMARVLMAIAGPEGARTVEARAARASGELKKQLGELLMRGGR